MRQYPVNVLLTCHEVFMVIAELNIATSTVLQGFFELGQLS